MSDQTRQKRLRIRALCAGVLWIAGLSAPARADCVDHQARITALAAGAALTQTERAAIAAELRAASAQTRREVCAQAARYVANRRVFRDAHARAAERVRLIAFWRFSAGPNGAQMQAVFAHDPLVAENRAAQAVVTESMVRARALQYQVLIQAAGADPSDAARPERLRERLRAQFKSLPPATARAWMRSEIELLDTVGFLRAGQPAARERRLRGFAASYNAGRLWSGARMFAAFAGQERRFNRAMRALSRSMTVDAIRRGVRDGP